MFLHGWSYTLSDSALRLFTLANPKLPPIAHGGSVLEVGSCDTDFVKRVKAADPSLKVTGLDQRKYNGKDPTDILLADVLTVDFPKESFDCVCSLSALEHIGLGRYQDPLDPDGDIKAVQRIREWLKPGGWLYFDVPYTPEGYQLFDTNKCRCYDAAALLERFGPHDVLGVATSHCEQWLPEIPTTNHAGPRPWWYIALLVRKDA